MAAGDTQVYGKFTELQADGATKVDWTSDDIAVSLHTSAYTPDIDAHDFADDLTNELASGDGYTTGGIVIASKTSAYDADNNRWEGGCANLVWNFTATKAPKWAVVRKDSGSAATSPLIGYIDCGTVSTDTTFTIQINAEGLLQFRATAQTA
jgi:hypothetical protein